MLAARNGQFQARVEALGMRFVGKRLSINQSSVWTRAPTATTWLQLQVSHLANGAVLTLREYLDSPLAQKPHVIKPAVVQAHRHTYHPRHRHQRCSGDPRLLRRYDHMIVEELVMDTEITVGVYGDQALPIIEIIPPVDGEFDFAIINGTTQELCPPEHVSSEMQKKAQELTLRVHEAAGCRPVSYRLHYHSEGEFYLLKTNTIPGMTGESLYPKMGKTAGIDFPELMSESSKWPLEH